MVAITRFLPFFLVIVSTTGFTLVNQKSCRKTFANTPPPLLASFNNNNNNHHHDDTKREEGTTPSSLPRKQQNALFLNRRELANMGLCFATTIASSLVAFGTREAAWAEEAVATADGVAPPAIKMEDLKSFTDPEGLFSITVPKRFFILRRSAKGDLPDEKTGQGRRGSSIFTSGDMSKAEIVAVERFPVRALLEDAGVNASGDLSTFPKIGTPSGVASLILLRRDRDKVGQRPIGTISNPVYSSDGKTLTFSVSVQLDVQNPELLYEQMGVRKLIRITSAKCTLDSNDGNVMGVFASALETDYDGNEGNYLRACVDSFNVPDRSATLAVTGQ